MNLTESPSGLPPTVIHLVDQLAKFPGVGRKSALRMAMYVLRGPREQAKTLADALLAVKDKVAFCRTCWSLSEKDPCSICTDSRREQGVVCVVEESRDMIAFERMGSWRGVYHILGGAIAPLDGIGPEQLRIDPLLDRVKSGRIEEVIVATNPTSEGETTALYIARLLKPTGVKISRIARGVPLGADLELVDDSTLMQSLEGRVEMKD